MPGAPEAFCLTEPQSPLVFTARSYGDFSSWHWNPGLGGLIWGWDTSLLRGKLHSLDIHPDFYPPHVGMGPACSTSLPLLVVSVWILLYILSCILSCNSVQLDFSWMMVILYFSCNFDVVVGGFKYCIYLCCHLDQKLGFLLFWYQLNISLSEKILRKHFGHLPYSMISSRETPTVFSVHTKVTLPTWVNLP